MLARLDVVICANVGNYLYKLLSACDTARIIGRCSEFLKKNGILVTDAPDAILFMKFPALIGNMSACVQNLDWIWIKN